MARDELRGDKTLRKRLAFIIDKTPLAMAIKLDDQANRLRGRAVAVAPELTRKLILSSRVTKQDSRARAIRVVSFDTDYAVVRHEDFYELGPISSAKAPTQDGPPGRKFLERPFRNMTKPMQRDLGKVPMDVAREAKRKVQGDD